MLTDALTSTWGVGPFDVNLFIHDAQGYGRKSLSEAGAYGALSCLDIELSAMSAADNAAFVARQELILFPRHAGMFVMGAGVAPSKVLVTLPDDEHRISTFTQGVKAP